MTNKYMIKTQVLIVEERSTLLAHQLLNEEFHKWLNDLPDGKVEILSHSISFRETSFFSEAIMHIIYK